MLHAKHPTMYISDTPANDSIGLAVVEEPDIPSGSSSEAFDPPKTPREGRLGKWHANKRRIELKEKLKEKLKGSPRKASTLKNLSIVG
jgi:hypothetical protein